LYCGDGVLAYAYNCYGRDLTTVRAGQPLTPGAHRLQVRFDYDGGRPGSGADVGLVVDDIAVGSGRLEATTAFYFSFDETFNVGVDRGTPVTAAYRAVHNRFTGKILRVHFDLAHEDPLEVDVRRRVTTLADD
jgi:arylsulfatase